MPLAHLPCSRPFLPEGLEGSQGSRCSHLGPTGASSCTWAAAKGWLNARSHPFLLLLVIPQNCRGTQTKIRSRPRSCLIDTKLLSAWPLVCCVTVARFLPSLGLQLISCEGGIHPSPGPQWARFQESCSLPATLPLNLRSKGPLQSPCGGGIQRKLHTAWSLMGVTDPG